MKKLFTLIACLAITMSSYADWTLNVGGQSYPMTLVEESNPQTYTASVELAPGSYAATITNGTKISSSGTTTFTISTTKIVKFWGQIPTGKDWIAGLCSEMEYPIVNSGWMYLCYVYGLDDNNNGIAYYNEPGTADLKSAQGTKSPSDTYWLTANSTGTPPFNFTYNNKTSGIKKLSLDYTTWKVTVDAATAIDVNVSAAGASTLVAPADLTIPAGVKAYTLDYDGSQTLVATEVTTTIPANTPVLLNAAEGTYSFAIAGTANIATDTKDSKTYMPDVHSTGNVLVGVMQPHYVPVGAYVLQNGENGVGFYQVDAKTTNYKINNYRCYVSLPAQASAKLNIVFPEDNPTGISNITTAQDNTMFNIAGQRVNTNTKGIVIKNGKKYLNK